MLQRQSLLSGSKLFLRNLSFTPAESVLSSGKEAADVLVMLENDDQ
jgi:hypothetical protein